MGTFQTILFRYLDDKVMPETRFLRLEAASKLKVVASTSKNKKTDSENSQPKVKDL